MGESGKSAAEQIIESSTQNFLTCRSLGHTFDAKKSAVAKANGKYFWSMTCSRCETSRTKILNSQGRIIGTGYTYPEGYTAPGVGRLDALGLARLRMHVMTNVLGL